MTAPFSSKLVCFCLVATTVLAVAPVGVSAPAVEPKAALADEAASPAIDPAKLAENFVLGIAAARQRTASSNNLKQIALGFHNYASVNGDRLPGDVKVGFAPARLSWRVSILPYVGEVALYKQFKLDEPWDSKHNLTLLAKMPKVYSSPRVLLKSKGHTVYQVFSGPGALYQDGKTRYNIGNIPDGTSNTILVVESSTAVPWTKPADIPYDRARAVPNFGRAYAGRPLASLADGSVRVLDLKKISPMTLKNAISPDDGNPLGADW
jgi:hypothetical protein